MTKSTSGLPFSSLNSSLAASPFLAVQGIIATESIFLPSPLNFSFITEANICIGERQVEMLGSISGYSFSAYFIHAGQHDVNSGSFPPFASLSANSFDSSITVRSAAVDVSKM